MELPHSLELDWPKGGQTKIPHIIELIFKCVCWGVRGGRNKQERWEASSPCTTTETRLGAVGNKQEASEVRGCWMEGIGSLQSTLASSVKCNASFQRAPPAPCFLPFVIWFQGAGLSNRWILECSGVHPPNSNGKLLLLMLQNWRDFPLHPWLLDMQALMHCLVT